MIDRVVAAEGWRVLGAALRYPDAALKDDLLALADAPEALRPLAELAAWVDDDLPGEHNRLFATRVAVPPYETAYLRADKGARLGQLAALYHAFGLSTGGSEHELPDHAGTEAQFAAALYVLEELATRRGEADNAAVAAQARQVFFDEHVSRWFPSFAERLSAEAAHPFYSRLGAVLGDWVRREIPASPGERLCPEAGDDDGCLSCPMARKEEGCPV